MSNLDPILEVLLQAGYNPDGQTATEIVRVPTKQSPLYGRTGGVRRSFGGRQRFTKAGTDIRVTVGPRTVNVYTAVEGNIKFLASYNTNEIDLDAFRKLVTEEKPR